MQYSQDSPPPPAPTKSSPDDSQMGKKIAISVIGIVVVLGLIVFSYFLGTRSTPDEVVEPTPTPADKLTNPFLELPENTPTPTKATTPTPTPNNEPTPTPKKKTMILESVASLDGFRSSNEGGNDTLEIRAGRNANLVTRGFVSFDIGDLPSGANVQTATIRLYQAKIVGSPYSAGGSLSLDHLTYGDSLDQTDYSTPALISNIVNVSSSESIGWKESDVSDAVTDDVTNSRSYSQFRMHFATEIAGGSTTGDFVYFDSSNDYEGSTGNVPQLIIEYY